MTPDREEQLISDVAWMRGKLESYFDQVSPTLATKESVCAVEKKIDDHVTGHVSNRGLVASYVGIVVALAGSIIAIFANKGGN